MGARKESERIVFEIPRLPVPCPRPRVTSRGKPYYGQRYFDWRVEVQVLANQARVECKARMFSGDVRLTITVYGAKRTGDWDNIGKGISDALQGVLYADDKQVRDASVRLIDHPRANGSKWTIIDVEEL